MVNMNNPAKIQLQSFNYRLPESHIAKYPLPERDQSKLLVYKNGNTGQDNFLNLAEHLSSEDLLVFNNTKVIPARLAFTKSTGAMIEIFCLTPHEPADYVRIFRQTRQCTWKCMIGNLKKWKHGMLEKEIIIQDEKFLLKAEKLEQTKNELLVRFSWDNPEAAFEKILEYSGITPIPPYLKRQSKIIDTFRYQTTYSKHQGSVAAPTAGLHFTDNIFEKLHAKKIKQAHITLHVGAGTFQPVKAETIDQHRMHTEHFTVFRSALEQIARALPNVTAVGTTSLRTLESLFFIGINLLKNNIFQPHIEQWAPYKMNTGSISVKQALQALIQYMEDQKQQILKASTALIIIPGYDFKIVNKLITNFHQPKSTLLLLVAAFIGDDWKKVYQYALDNDFRFLSYGDSSVLSNTRIE